VNRKCPRNTILQLSTPYTPTLPISPQTLDPPQHFRISVATAYGYAVSHVWTSKKYDWQSQQFWLLNCSVTLNRPHGRTL